MQIIANCEIEIDQCHDFCLSYMWGKITICWTSL